MNSAFFIVMSSVTLLNPASDIDSFNYPTTTAALKQWQPQWNSCSIKTIPQAGSSVFQIDIPFGQNRDIKRGTLDRQLKLNLMAPSQFQIDIKTVSANRAGKLSLYFHSGAGWYVASTVLPRQKKSSSPQWQTITFHKNDFRKEDKPSNWKQIDRVRLALWNSEAKNVSVQFRNFKTHCSRIAVIVPKLNTGDLKTSHSAAKSVTKLLKQMGLQSDLILESDMPNGGLGQRPIAILPYNPELQASATNALKNYLLQGGKLFVCYRIPKALQNVMGIQTGKYYRPTTEQDKFTTIHFENRSIHGLPEIVDQASWNITTGVPVGHRARALGYWYNKRGENTKLPAMIISDRGIFFSHLLLLDDAERKALMLASLLGKMHPPIWKDLVESTVKQGQQIGSCSNVTDLKAYIKKTQGESGLQLLKQADRLQASIPDLLAKGQGVQALTAAKNAHALRSNTYLKSISSIPVESRALWEHAGTGAYPGDWERTIKELKQAGFNMIIPNMLWGGSANYPSNVLPRNQVYEQYGDQIKKCVTAAKKHGIEVHIWKVNFNLSRASKGFIQKMRDAGRTQIDVNGNDIDWLNPAHPKNFQLEQAAMLEVVRNYDIDGIHFDYIRYPNSDSSFDPLSRKLFEAATALPVINWPRDCYRGGKRAAEYNNWRAAQITKLVSSVSREARKLKPDIKISAAVFRDYPSCHDTVAQDWPIWVNKGYLNFLCPMNYTADDEQYAQWIQQQRKLIGPKFPLYPGIGASSSRTTLTSDRVAAQIEITRKTNADGFTIFNLNAETARRIFPGLKLGATSSPARTKHHQ